MKQTLLNICLFIGGTIAIVGCGTMAQTYGTTPIAYPEMSAELTVNTDNKLTATNSTTYLFGVLKVSGGNKLADIPADRSSIFGGQGNLSRAAATYKAIENYDYDVVVAPNYRTTKKIGFLHLWTTYKTTMTGYGAKITSLNMTDGQETDVASVRYTDTTEDIKNAKEAKKSGNAPKANPIFLSKNLEMFEKGSINAAPKSEQKTYEKEFVDEIESNLSKAKTKEEYDFIQRKVDALKAYNAKLSQPKKDIAERISGFEKKIERGISRLSGEKKGLIDRIKK